MPTDFKHHTHVGLNPKTGAFDVQNLPEAWKKLFANAGISDTELEDPTNSEMIMNIIVSAQEKKGKSEIAAPAEVLSLVQPFFLNIALDCTSASVFSTYNCPTSSSSTRSRTTGIFLLNISLMTRCSVTAV